MNANDLNDKIVSGVESLTSKERYALAILLTEGADSLNKRKIGDIKAQYGEVGYNALNETCGQ
jgi:hypothetical protein